MAEKQPNKTKFILIIVAGMALSFSYYALPPIYIKSKARSSEYKGTITDITGNWLPSHSRKMPHIYQLSDGSNIYENVFFRDADFIIRGDSVYKAADSEELEVYKKENGTWELYGKYAMSK